MKVILNKCFGGFGISPACYKLYAEKKGLTLYPYIRQGDFYKRLNWENADDDRIGYIDYLTTDRDVINYYDETVNKNFFYISCEHREDPVLIECVEELGEKANGNYADLVVVDIPDGLDYVIDDYDGIETLHQKVQEW